MDDRSLTGLRSRASYRVQRDRHRLDERPVRQRDVGRKAMHHRAVHDGVLRQTATTRAQAMDGQPAAQVVATAPAGCAVSARHERLDRDLIAFVHVGDARTDRSDDARQLVPENHRNLRAGHRVWGRWARGRSRVVLVEV